MKVNPQAWYPKMDITKKGLLMFFKDYQLAVLESIWRSESPMSSRDCWEAINKEKSRASIINFLESATQHGLLLKHEITGKGGHRGMYQAAYDRERTKDFLKKLFSDRLDYL